MRNGRLPCCDGNQVKRGPWSRAEDLKLTAFIQKYGHDNWLALPKQAGLLRCGKSCRLRWINYLRPDLKRGNFTEEEFETIMKLHETLGNKWSKIASYFPGRTDNEIKNVWNTHLKKRLPKNTNPGSSSNENKLKSPIASSQVATKNKVEQDSVKQVSIELIGVSKNPNESSTSLSSIESNIFNSSQMVGYKPEQKMDSPSKYLGPYNVNNALQDVDKPNPLLEIPSETDYDFWKELDNISVHELGNEYGSGATKEANKNQLPQKNDAAEQAKDPHSFDFDLMTTPESNSNIDMGYVHWWSPFPQNPGL